MIRNVKMFEASINHDAPRLTRWLTPSIRNSRLWSPQVCEAWSMTHSFEFLAKYHSLAGGTGQMIMHGIILASCIVGRRGI